MSNTFRSFFQLLPAFKGKLRLARIFNNKKIKNHQEYFFGVKNGLNFFVPNLIENVYFELYAYGYYEKETVDFFVKTIPQNGVFVDVGANIGSISVFVARLRPDVKVYSFEAAPAVYKYLAKNIEINQLSNIKAYNYAIHKTDNIQLPFFSPTDKSGKGSFSSVFTNEAVMVNTLNLDNFFQKNNIAPNAIKVDVEGYEKLIFESMESFLKTSKDCFVLFEHVDWAEDFAEGCKSGDAQITIKEYGYHLMELEEDKLTPRDFIQYKGSCENLLATKNINFSIPK